MSEDPTQIAKTATTVVVKEVVQRVWDHGLFLLPVFTLISITLCFYEEARISLGIMNRAWVVLITVVIGASTLIAWGRKLAPFVQKHIQTARLKKELSVMPRGQQVLLSSAANSGDWAIHQLDLQKFGRHLQSLSRKDWITVRNNNNIDPLVYYVRQERLPLIKKMYDSLVPWQKHMNEEWLEGVDSNESSKTVLKKLGRPSG